MLNPSVELLLSRQGPILWPAPLFGYQLDGIRALLVRDALLLPAVERQAEDRSHRLGQAYPVHVFAYACAETIEERIASLLRRKQQLFDELIDSVSLDLTTVLTSDELFGLFGLPT